MRIAVIEHKLCSTAVEDAALLAAASVAANEGGAEIIFLPAVLASSDVAAQQAYATGVAGITATRLLPNVAAGTRGRVFSARAIDGAGERLGQIALAYGDACFDEVALAEVRASRPDVLVMAPLSENELQAAAVLELAVGLSESVAPLVVVAEPVGAGFGEPGQGGSAIVLLGKVLAEAVGHDGDVLFAEVPEPLPRPEPPDPLPAVPTILAQRAATHEGRKLDMGYLADLSDGSGTS